MIPVKSQYQVSVKKRLLNGEQYNRGYRGHKIEDIKVWISGMKRGVTGWYKKQLARRQAIEPRIGHMKSDGKLKRNYLKGVLGDQLNAILCGVGENCRIVLRGMT
jgi:IS5 family transposase